VSSNGRDIAHRKEEYERERNVVLRDAARGIHIFFCRDLNLNGRTAAQSFRLFRVCVQGIPYDEHKGEWFISRGERVREICISTYRPETSAVLKFSADKSDD